MGETVLFIPRTLPVGKKDFLQVDGEMEREVHHGVTISVIYRIHHVYLHLFHGSRHCYWIMRKVPHGLGFWASLRTLALSGKVNLLLII